MGTRAPRLRRQISTQLLHGKNIDVNFDDEEYEKASTYFDKYRHFLMLLAINTSVILSMVLSIAAGLRMYKINNLKVEGSGVNAYVIMTFSFAGLCLVFMIIINWFYKDILKKVTAKP